MPTSARLRKPTSRLTSARPAATAPPRRLTARVASLGALACATLFAASVSAAGVATAAPAETPAPGAVSTRPVDPPPPACTGTTRSAKLRLSASGETESYWTHVSPDGSLTSDRWAQLRKPTNIGAPQVTVTTCRDATGRWRLHSYTAANQLPDLAGKTAAGRVRFEPRAGAYGWGVFARGIKGSTLTLEVARCVRTPQSADDHGVGKTLPGLPLPGKRSYPLGSWIADTPLPAAPKGAAKGASTCGDLSRVTVPLTVSSTGAPSVARTTRGVSNAQWVTGPVCPAQDSTCSQNVREVVTVLARP